MLLTNLTEVTTEETQEALEALGGFFHNLNLRTLLTIGLLIVGCLVVMKIVLRLLDRTFRRLELERGLCTFLHAALRVVLWLVTVCIVLGYIGVPMTSLVALVGVIGLAVSLASRVRSPNLAGGIQVLVSKPFKAGDYVEAGGVSGTVKEVGLAYTKLATVDNKVISVPNGQISAEKIINYTTGGDAAGGSHLQRLLRRPASEGDRDHPAGGGGPTPGAFTPEPFIRVNAYKDSSVRYVVRVWCATADLLAAVPRSAGTGEGGL